MEVSWEKQRLVNGDFPVRHAWAVCHGRVSRWPAAYTSPCGRLTAGGFHSVSRCFFHPLAKAPQLVLVWYTYFFITDGYHQILFVIISILKINVFNGSSWWSWDACAFFQGDVLHVKRIDFSASRWISGLKITYITCGTEHPTKAGLAMTQDGWRPFGSWHGFVGCSSWILPAPSPRACLMRRFGRDGPNLCLQRGDVPMLLYILSRLPLLDLLWNKCFGSQPWKDIRYQIWKGMRPEKKYENRKVAPTTWTQEGSPDRIGFDQHVLPNLYAAAQGVYAARHDQAWRVKLLQAAPEERRCLDGHGIWDGYQFWIFLNGI